MNQISEKTYREIQKEASSYVNHFNMTIYDIIYEMEKSRYRNNYRLYYAKLRVATSDGVADIAYELCELGYNMAAARLFAYAYKHTGNKAYENNALLLYEEYAAIGRY
jgi:hypothetical protein